jgi:hypothetical protein
MFAMSTPKVASQYGTGAAKENITVDGTSRKSTQSALLPRAWLAFDAV